VPLLPTYRAILRVDAEPAVVEERLSELLTERLFDLLSPAALFRGWVADGRFELGRARGLMVSDSVDPRVAGEIVRAGFGSEVRLTMRLDRTTAAFQVVWMVIVAAVVLRTSEVAFREAFNLLGGLLLTTFFLAAGVALIAVVHLGQARTFRAQARWVTEHLRDGLGAIVTEESGALRPHPAARRGDAG
jgi:hypothetical protein